MPQIISIIMLLWALNPKNPYGYYVLLRIVLCAVCTFLAFRALEIENTAWAWILGMMAVIYNPIIPIHLTRKIWSVVNALTIVVLSMTFVTLRKKTVTQQKGEGTDDR